MTTSSANLADLAKERSSAMSTSTAPKQHTDYPDRTEPRSSAMDYTNGSNNNNNNIVMVNNNGSNSAYSSRHHYNQEHNGGYNDEYYDQQQHHSNGHSHHSSLSSPSSHYPHNSNGPYPPPIQTAPFTGHGNGSSQPAHGSFIPPTSPVSSNGAQHGYQHQQSNYEYDHPQSQSHYHGYHGHQPSYSQDHHTHPLSPSTEGSGHHFYNGHSASNTKPDGANGPYSSSSPHYSRGHPYNSNAHGYSGSNHVNHGSFDSGLPEGHGAGLGIEPESMNGRHDSSSIIYSTSAPSPSTVHSLASRPKRRTDLFAHQESPYFYATQQHYNIQSLDRNMSYEISISAKIDRGFFLAGGDWTCYRRNYFQLSASFSIKGLDSPNEPEVPCLLQRNGELVTVRAFLICIGAQIQNGEKVIELVQHTPKRDKGPQITPRPTHIRAGGDLNLCSSGSSPNVITFERVQFKTATANNGKRRAAQQYYQVHVDLFAELDNGDLVLVANAFSAPLVVRGRSPGHYADNEDAIQESGDVRYHYRNDSISSAGGGGPLGSPVSPGEHPYYPGYGYGSSYPYQSLGSASHLATQPTHDSSYYARKDSESYPASPMSAAGPHPGESVSPDMYSPSGFVPESPSSSYHRLPQLSSHQQGYNGPYGQYSPYGGPQHHDVYRDQDHESQMAGLRIHSPTLSSSTGSPLATPRRQSFSTSLITKKSERGIGGSTMTRKSRSISLSGTTTTTTMTVNKLPSNKPRPSRTVPVTPTRDMGGKNGSHLYPRDRIPESPMEEQHAM